MCRTWTHRASRSVRLIPVRVPALHAPLSCPPSYPRRGESRDVEHRGELFQERPPDRKSGLVKTAHGRMEALSLTGSKPARRVVIPREGDKRGSRAAPRIRGCPGRRGRAVRHAGAPGGCADVRDRRCELSIDGMAGTAALGLRLLEADAAGSLGPMTATVVTLGAGGSGTPSGDVSVSGLEGEEAATAIDITPLGVSPVGAILLPWFSLRSLRAAGVVVSAAELLSRAGAVTALFVATLGGRPGRARRHHPRRGRAGTRRPARRLRSPARTASGSRDSGT